MRRADVPPLAAREGDPLERLREGVAEDLRAVETLEEAGAVLLAALERVGNLSERGNERGFSTGKSAEGIVQCPHDQRSRPCRRDF